MTVTYANHPRGFRPDAPEAVHLATAEAYAASTTACSLSTNERLLTNTLERVTCRDCRSEIEAAE